MRISTNDYRRGIQALNNFMDMLHLAMLEVMPSADLARTAGFGWRGFQIRKNEDLAGGQYYSQINLEKPDRLILQEAYQHGVYQYPWRVELDLQICGFFRKGPDGQKGILVDFLQSAISQAQQWQHSKKRRSVVPREKRTGREFLIGTTLECPAEIRAVSPLYIDAIHEQNRLFGRLWDEIGQAASEAGLRNPYLRCNALGWRYRGLWMKLPTREPEDTEPEGEFPYHWKIYFHPDPAALLFEGLEAAHCLDLDQHFYFSLDEKNQAGTLADFVRPIIREIKEGLEL